MKKGNDFSYEVGGMFYKEGDLDTYNRYFEIMIRPLVMRRRGRGIKVDDVSPVVVPAIINHGRWMVACPWCSGAEPVYFDKLQFMCLSCFNDRIGGRFAHIRLPREWRAIEAILSKRPLPHQNYQVGETLMMLKAENETRGIR